MNPVTTAVIPVAIVTIALIIFYFVEITSYSMFINTNAFPYFQFHSAATNLTTPKY
jgi:hypothetical protein